MRTLLSELMLAVGALAAQGVPLNGDSPLLAAVPSFVTRPSGGAIYLWSAYDRGREWVLSADIDGDRRGRVRQLSPGAGVYCQPRLAAAGNALWAFWTRQWLGRWQVLGASAQQGEWGPATVFSDPGEESMAPAVGISGASLVLAFEAHARPQQIKVRVRGGQAWKPAVAISQRDVPSYRPAIAVTADGEVWVF